MDISRKRMKTKGFNCKRDKWKHWRVSLCVSWFSPYWFTKRPLRHYQVNWRKCSVTAARICDGGAPRCQNEALQARQVFLGLLRVWRSWKLCTDDSAHEKLQDVTQTKFRKQEKNARGIWFNSFLTGNVLWYVLRSGCFVHWSQSFRIILFLERLE